MTGPLLSAVLATNLSNSNAAETMTALGLYIHAFFLVLDLGLAPLVLILEAVGIRKLSLTRLRIFAHQCTDGQTDVANEITPMEQV